MPLVDFDESEARPDEPEPNPEWVVRSCRRRTGFVMVKGQLVPATCWASFCPDCGPWKALATAQATAEALAGTGQLTRFIRFHGLEEAFDDRCAQMTGLTKGARRASSAPFDLAYVTHVNVEREHSGVHVHGLARGEQAAMDYLAEEAEEFFDPDPYIEPVRDPRGAAYYMLESVLPLNATPRALDHSLGLNGGQFVRASRNYYEDGMKAAVNRERARNHLNLLGDVITRLPTAGERTLIESRMGESIDRIIGGMSLG